MRDQIANRTAEWKDTAISAYHQAKNHTATAFQAAKDNTRKFLADTRQNIGRKWEKFTDWMRGAGGQYSRSILTREEELQNELELNRTLSTNSTASVWQNVKNIWNAGFGKIKKFLSNSITDYWHAYIYPAAISWIVLFLADMVELALSGLTFIPLVQWVIVGFLEAAVSGAIMVLLKENEVLLKQKFAAAVDALCLTNENIGNFFVKLGNKISQSKETFDWVFNLVKDAVKERAYDFAEKVQTVAKSGMELTVNAVWRIIPTWQKQCPAVGDYEEAGGRSGTSTTSSTNANTSNSARGGPVTSSSFSEMKIDSTFLQSGEITTQFELTPTGSAVITDGPVPKLSNQCAPDADAPAKQSFFQNFLTTVTMLQDNARQLFSAGIAKAKEISQMLTTSDGLAQLKTSIVSTLKHASQFVFDKLQSFVDKTGGILIQGMGAEVANNLARRSANLMVNSVQVITGATGFVHGTVATASFAALGPVLRAALDAALQQLV
ncbi:unnamed protein product, partial [Amoebophrya sp. A120]|eukprot:GSA120T00000141001.1